MRSGCSQQSQHLIASQRCAPFSCVKSVQSSPFIANIYKFLAGARCDLSFLFSLKKFLGLASSHDSASSRGRSSFGPGLTRRLLVLHLNITLFRRSFLRLCLSFKIFRWSSSSSLSHIGCVTETSLGIKSLFLLLLYIQLHSGVSQVSMRSCLLKFKI